MDRNNVVALADQLETGNGDLREGRGKNLARNRGAGCVEGIDGRDLDVVLSGRGSFKIENIVAARIGQLRARLPARVADFLPTDLELRNVLVYKTAPFPADPDVGQIIE